MSFDTAGRCFLARHSQKLQSRLGLPRLRRHIAEEDRLAYLQDLHVIAQRVEIGGSVMDCRDTGDDKFLETALVGAADCMVSGDQDLLVLDPFRGIPILTPAEFVLKLSL